MHGNCMETNAEGTYRLMFHTVDKQHLKFSKTNWNVFSKFLGGSSMLMVIFLSHGGEWSAPGSGRIIPGTEWARM
jgi:hypothetical protein